MSDRITGKVKWFSDEKGYGFLTDGDKDYFVHISDLSNSGMESLKDGDEVSFTTQPARKGEKAVNIKTEVN